MRICANVTGAIYNAKWDLALKYMKDHLLDFFVRSAISLSSWAGLITDVKGQRI